MNRITVNRAVAILRGEGLVRVERGRGTTVREIPLIRRAAPGRFARHTREQAGARGAFDAEICERWQRGSWPLPVPGLPIMGL